MAVSSARPLGPAVSSARPLGPAVSSARPRDRLFLPHGLGTGCFFRTA